METEESLSCSWEPATVPYPKPNESSTQISAQFLRTVLKLSSHLSLRLPSGSFHSGFPSKILYALLISPMLVTSPVHFIILDFITVPIIGEGYKLWSSSVWRLPQPSATFSVLVPNTLFNTLFSDTFNLRSSVSLKDQDSHPYRTTCKIILYILNSKLIERRREVCSP